MPKKLKSPTTTKRSQIQPTAVHPGKVLLDELVEIQINQSTLAAHIGVLPKTINEICRGKRGISAEMAHKLSRALGASPEFWLNLQLNWELSQVAPDSFKTIPRLAA
jgi:addiction module HigA family antidote